MSNKIQLDAERYCRSNAGRMGQMPNGQFISELMLEELTVIRLRAEQAEARCKMMEEYVSFITNRHNADGLSKAMIIEKACKALEDK